MPKKLKHKDTEDTDAQTTQAQSTDGQGADQDVVDLIVLIPDDEYADVDAVIVQIELTTPRRQPLPPGRPRR